MSEWLIELVLKTSGPAKPRVRGFKSHLFLHVREVTVGWLHLSVKQAPFGASGVQFSPLAPCLFGRVVRHLSAKQVMRVRFPSETPFYIFCDGYSVVIARYSVKVKDMGLTPSTHPMLEKLI